MAKSKPVAAVEFGPPVVNTKRFVDLTTGEPVDLPFFDLNVSARKHYSHSFVKDLGQCSGKAWFRSIHAPAKKIFAMERGSCAHEALELFEKEGKEPTKTLPDLWQKYILDNAEKMSAADQKKIEKGYDETKLMLEEWINENKELMIRVKPEDVEVEFTLDVPLQIGDRKFTRPFTGKLDLVLWTTNRKSYRIMDWKTSAKAPSTDELEQEAQFALYQWAATKLFGFPPKAMDYYLLMGQHGCEERFSAKAHPRDPLLRIPGCWINYALEVPLFSEEKIADLFNAYYAPLILKYEAGIFGKEGRADYRNQCERCQYKETCDNTKSFPAPVFLGELVG